MNIREHGNEGISAGFALAGILICAPFFLLTAIICLPVLGLRWLVRRYLGF